MYDVITFFDWDKEKARKNNLKHRVSFEEAVSVFYDELAKIMDDHSHSIIEKRFILIGYSHQGRLLFVCHSFVGKYEKIRIISAREATRREENDFEELKV